MYAYLLPSGTVKISRKVENALWRALVSLAMCKMCGAEMYNISKEAFMKMNIVFPVSVEEQNCVSNYFKGLNDMIILNEHELGRWQSLKKALLQQMFV